MSIVDAVLEVDAVLAGACPAHAFGGALALAYYAEPRATVDMDVNVFAVEEGGVHVMAALAQAGYVPERGPGGTPPISGIRLRHHAGPFPLDLFLPLGPEYDEIGRRVRRWPFGPDHTQLPFLSAEDLAVFKLSFGRDKDWVDLRRMCRSGLSIDVEYIARQLVDLRGPTMYPRIARFRAFAA